MSAINTTCPPESTLSDFGLGKLDAASADTVSQHLETCADCRQRVANLSGDSFVGRLRQAGGAAKPAARRERTYVPGESLANAANSTDGSSREDGLPRPSRTIGDTAKQDGLGSPSSVAAPPELANHPDYELLKQLGQGGMGTVYLARNRMMDRLEVLKVISKALLDRPGALERFHQEIRSAAKLAHPNIVAAYSVLRPGDLLVFAMEYVKGQDLSQVVKARGYVPVANAAFYIHQVALGLQHAHEKGMVHRDIKPNNLMLAIEGKKHVVKILDFGLAKATSEKGAETGLTKSGQMLGTPDYVAPEQTLNAHQADIRADIYSLGCTLYFLLSGGPPFQETSLYEILEAHHKRDPKPLNLVRPDVPVELAAVVGKMMAKDPAKRYQTPNEVAKALVPFFKPGQAASAATLPPRADDVSPLATAETIHAAASATEESVPAQSAPLIPAPIPVGATPISLSPVPLAVASPALGISIDTHRNAGRRRGWWRSLLPGQQLAIGGGAAGVLLLGIVLLVRTPRGTVEITLDDPNAKVTLTVDKDTIDLQELDHPLSFTVGEHNLTVKGEGFETVTKKFSVTKGKNAPLTIALLPQEDGRPESVANSKPVEQSAKPTVLANVATTGVPADAQEFGGHWYKFYPEQLSWTAARNRCQSYEGRLVVIDSLEENRFVANLVERAGWADAWIGATDEAEEGKWLTVEGELLNFANWFGNQPDNSGGEHYALMSKRALNGTDMNWQWNDQSNRAKSEDPGFVCEWTSMPSSEQSGGPQERFVALFNGKDLTGWKTHPDQPGNWRVENGVLVGSGPTASHLFSERGNFTNLHIRAEARINKGGNSGIYCRSSFALDRGGDNNKFPDGYEAQINSTGNDKNKTGGLYTPGGALATIIDSAVAPDEWFTLELIAIDNHLVVKVNGKTTADYIDSAGRFPTGHIALQQHDPQTVVEFRKIEIKEANASAAAATNKPTEAASSNDTPATLANPPATTAVPVEHSAPIRSAPRLLFSTRGSNGVAALSPDGSEILGVNEGVVHLWDAAGKNTRQIAPKADPRRIAFLPDGNRAVTGDVDGRIVLWDVATAKQLGSFEGNANCISDISISDDSRLLLTCCYGLQHAGGFTVPGQGNAVRLWDMETRKEIRRIEGTRAPTRSAAFLPGSHRVLWGSEKGVLGVWDADNGMQLPEIARDLKQIYHLSISPDGRFAATTMENWTVCVWDVRAKKLIRSLDDPPDQPVSAIVSADGSRVISLAREGQARLWDVATGQEIACTNTNAEYKWAAFARQARAALLAAGEGVYEWDLPPLPSGKGVAAVVGPASNPGPASPVAFIKPEPVFQIKARRREGAALSPDAKTILADDDGVMRLWDIAKGQAIREIAPRGDPSCAAFLPNDPRAIVGDYDGGILLCDTSTGSSLGKFEGNPQVVQRVSVSDDLRFVLTCCDGEAKRGPDGSARDENGKIRPVWYGSSYSVRLWDLETRREIRRLEDRGARVAAIAAFLPQSHHVMWGSHKGNKGSLGIWDAETGAEVAEIERDGPRVNDLSISPGGRLVAAALANWTIGVWDLETHKPLQKFKGLKREPRRVVFSPDGTRLLSLASDARLWDVFTGDEIANTGDQQGYSYAAFYPDGRAALLASDGGHFHKWELPPPRAKPAANKPNPAAASVPPADPAHERQVAEWVLARGGRLRVEGVKSVIFNAAKLPAGPVNINEIDLNRTDITDEDLARMRNLPHLVRLSIDVPAITDDGLAQLRGLPALRRLSVARTKVTGAGLEHVKQFAGLTELFLYDSQVDDDGLRALQKLPLESLWLGGTAVTGDGLREIKELPLRSLSLDGLSIANRDLVALQGMRTLHELSLDGTEISDAGLARLEGMTQLTKLGLKKTRVSSVAVKALRASLPVCKIDSAGASPSKRVEPRSDRRSKRPSSVPADAQAFEGHWYMFFPQQLTWKAARDLCQLSGGYLVVIDSSEENRFVADLVAAAGFNDTWLGITDEVQTRIWRTIDGEPLKFTNWMPNEPNNNGGVQHYGVMSKRDIWGKDQDWKWDDNANQPQFGAKPGIVCEWEPRSVPAGKSRVVGSK